MLRRLKLHPYQKTAVRNIRTLLEDGQRPLCYAPTGAGKTVVAGEIMAKVADGLKLFVVHTGQLRQQAGEYLRQFRVSTLTIQSLLLRPDLAADASIVCWDECHHLKGPERTAWRDATALFKPNVAMFGLSATPFAKSLDETFSARLTIARVEQLVAGGYILPVSIRRPSDLFVNGLAPNERIAGVRAYVNNYRGHQAVHFEPDVARCEDVRQQYAELGVKAAVVTGKTPPGVREVEIDRFRRCETQVLISPVLLSEGFDAPCAEVLVAARAFKSDVMLHQAVGRIRRTYPGKTQAIVLDCTGCCAKRSAQYFNETDETLFTREAAAKESRELAEAERRVARGVRAQNLVWVDCPADQWVTEAPLTVAETLRRQENADLVSQVESMIDEARLEKKREAGRKAERKRRQDPVKLEKIREATRKALQDPAKREAYREADREAARKRRQDPAVREKIREANRESARKRRQDPTYREACKRRAAAWRAKRKAEKLLQSE